jgi:hypothetical protein
MGTDISDLGRTVSNIILEFSLTWSKRQSDRESGKMGSVSTG